WCGGTDGLVAAADALPPTPAQDEPVAGAPGRELRKACTRGDLADDLRIGRRVRSHRRQGRGDDPQRVGMRVALHGQSVRADPAEVVVLALDVEPFAPFAEHPQPLAEMRLID